VDALIERAAELHTLSAAVAPPPEGGVGARLRFRLPPALHFGRGVVDQLPPVLGELGVERPLLVTDPGVAATGLPERLQGELRAAGFDPEVWDGARPEPGEEHAEACRGRLEELGSDGVVALGGGSTIDVAKVAAVVAGRGGRVSEYWGFDKVRRPALPLVTVPTTAGSGSEVSSHAVLIGLEPRKKEVVGGLHVMARAAVVDPELTHTLPREATLHAALDGLVHALEASVARRATPMTDAFALPAVARIAAALPRVIDDPLDAEARAELGLGCLGSGCAMANANAGAIHALGYPLSARHGIPHGLANALVAAATLEYTWPARPERYAALARAFGGGEPAELGARMRAFLGRVGVELGLEGHGVAEAELAELAEAANLFRPVLDNTPAELAVADLEEIYRAAWAA